MNILLSFLLVIFISIEIPLFIMMWYLYNHTAINFKVSKMREILFVITSAKAFFVLSQIILVSFSLFQYQQGMTIVLYSYTVGAVILAFVNWWAFFRIRSII